MPTRSKTYIDRTNKEYQGLTVKSPGPDRILPSGTQTSWWCECKQCGCGFIVPSHCLSNSKGPYKMGCKSCSFRQRQIKNRQGKSHGGLTLLYLTYQNNAKKMGRDFCLSREEFKCITSQHCQYCGTEPTQIAKASHNNGRTLEGVDWSAYTYNGIDRVDNNLGYTIDNCVPCCGSCNLMKRSFSAIQFIKHISNIYKHIHK